ncbi:MAG: hypothetical protein WC861_00180 [Candidatus Micrarchaeia archaeon]|jgi:hypothetical protein
MAGKKKQSKPKPARQMPQVPPATPTTEPIPEYQNILQNILNSLQAMAPDKKNSRMDREIQFANIYMVTGSLLFLAFISALTIPAQKDSRWVYNFHQIAYLMYGTFPVALLSLYLGFKHLSNAEEIEKKIRDHKSFYEKFPDAIVLFWNLLVTAAVIFIIVVCVFLVLTVVSLLLSMLAEFLMSPGFNFSISLTSILTSIEAYSKDFVVYFFQIFITLVVLGGVTIVAVIPAIIGLAVIHFGSGLLEEVASIKQGELMELVVFIVGIVILLPAIGNLLGLHDWGSWINPNNVVSFVFFLNLDDPYHLTVIGLIVSLTIMVIAGVHSRAELKTDPI